MKLEEPLNAGFDERFQLSKKINIIFKSLDLFIIKLLANEAALEQV